eukprot:TRINITY_DN1751_c0_g2_i2.p1 TRINITY_DN1751_c0_g2~~TRINITY_DN1751_c0_g2_i2.p1  ORF type:complete len:455 (+),score=91.44 TRINITY_DN1751_c0_g2_i2:403-1767(+)
MSLTLTLLLSCCWSSSPCLPMADVTAGRQSDLADPDLDPSKTSNIACGRCSKPANMQCPKCLELKLPRAMAAFCSQECFKAAWSTHKLIHKGVLAAASCTVGNKSQQDGTVAIVSAKAEGIDPDRIVSMALAQGWQFVIRKGQGRADALPNFDWTGSLRPFPISPRLLVPEGIERPDWATIGMPEVEPLSPWQNSVEIKTAEQIERLRKTCMIARQVLDIAAQMIKPGVTTDEIDRVVHEATTAAGGYPSPLNYYYFPKSCCTSVNEVVCHGIPDARPLQDGDIVNVDVSVYRDGCHGDLNETYVVGEADEASKHLVKTTLECLEQAIAIVKPGVRYREVGEVISRRASAGGVSVVRTYCGHGLGELFHCAPNIPHYARNKAVGIMKAGQTFTIEPMINAGSWRDRTWPDGWTAVTSDGSRSAQFEHTLLVTETGCEVLTARLPTSPKFPHWMV